MWQLYSLFFLIASVSSNSAAQLAQWGSSIDALMQRLQRDSWEREEAPCLQSTLTLLHNVKNHTLWASWIWNANSLITGNMYSSHSNFGNFDQCMKPPWLHTHPELKTKYCIGKMAIPGEVKDKPEYDPYGSSVEYLNVCGNANNSAAPEGMSLFWSAVYIIFINIERIFQIGPSPTLSGLPVNVVLWGLCVPASCGARGAARLAAALCEINACAPGSPELVVDHCQTAGEKMEYSAGFYVFIVLIVSLILIAAASTYYRSHIANDDQPPDSIETIITKSFCLKKNCDDLLKENKAEISVMNGMRFLTAVTVISVHQMFYMVMLGIANGQDYDKNLEGIGGIFLHVDVIVDTFFVMSGLLHIKGLMANPKRQQNLFSVLWKRYVRLIGPFALIIFYLISVSKHTGSGPVWIWGNKLEGDICSETWRGSLLMLNTDPKYICHAVTWYVPCDYQLAILGTLLFYFYKKDRRLGFTAFGTAAVLSLIIPAVLTYWYQLPVVHFTDLGKLLNQLRNYWEISYTYTPSYSRAGAYLVGVAMGYLMTLYKPDDYRKSVSLTLSILGTTLALVTMVLVMFLGKYYLYREYAPIEAAVVAATNRIVWAVAICCIIAFCEYGTVPIISDILSVPLFTPLSRLSYGIYMIHPLIIQRKTFTQRAPITYDLFSVIFDTTATLVLSISLSFAMWLLIEAPLINMSNHFLFNRSKSIQTNNESDKNGHIAHQNGTAKSKTS